jgi:hypothetical protein
MRRTTEINKQIAKWVVEDKVCLEREKRIAGLHQQKDKIYAAFREKMRRATAELRTDLRKLEIKITAASVNLGHRRGMLKKHWQE